jgi:hypothetical protein
MIFAPFEMRATGPDLIRNVSYPTTSVGTEPSIRPPDLDECGLIWPNDDLA